MNTTVNNPRENMNRVNNAQSLPNDWHYITNDENDPRALVRLYCSTPDSPAAFVAGWTNREAAARWMADEKAAQRQKRDRLIVDDRDPRRLVFCMKGKAGHYIHELRETETARTLDREMYLQRIILHYKSGREEENNGHATACHILGNAESIDHRNREEVEELRNRFESFILGDAFRLDLRLSCISHATKAGHYTDRELCEKYTPDTARRIYR